MKPRGLILAGTFVVLLVAAGFAAHELPASGCSAVEAAGDSLIIPVAHLAPGAVKFFCYRDNTGEKLRFLLARDEDGKVKAVFDACQRCYRYHEGYRYENGYVICRFCGTRYKVHDLQQGDASCVPAALQSHKQGAAVRIKISDLRRSRDLF